MRLDHLLSKEHSAGLVGAAARLSVWWPRVWSIVAVISECLMRGVLISGALVIQPVVVAGSASTAVVVPLSRWGHGVGMRVLGAGAGWAHCWVLRERTVSLRAVSGLLLAGGGPLRCGVGLFSPGLVSCHTGLGFSSFVGWGLGVWWWGGLVVWLLFVNCIVDASIFVAKLFRAHGGCLGIRSR